MSEAGGEVLAAVAAGDPERVRTIVAADPGAAAARDAVGVSAVLQARYRGDLASVAALREALAAADVPFDVFEAAAFGEASRLAAILAADPGAARAWSGDGFTALHLAAFFGGAGVVRPLLGAGADPDAVARNPMEVRPLHSAVAGGDPDAALALIAVGADVDARQRHGWTPLHGAAQGGMGAVVDALLTAGADPRATNDAGVDAATLADEAGHAAVAARIRAAEPRPAPNAG
ncbi:MAG: ankyrin repeat domain-containing protein [Chloroflexota bacterium]